MPFPSKNGSPWLTGERMGSGVISDVSSIGTGGWGGSLSLFFFS